MTLVLFATPSLDHRVCMDFFCSSLETQRLLMAAGIGQGYIQIGGDCYLAKVRNKLVAQFLAHADATDLFFLDDDIGWQPEKVIEFLSRPEEVVAGIYPKKSDDLDFPVELEADAETGQLIERDGMVRASAVPTGFLRIKRAAIERLVAANGVFRETERGETKEYPHIFAMGMGDTGWWWGEDYVFCRKHIALGGEIWVDPTCRFSHRGSKAWRASLVDHLPAFRAQALQMTPQRGAA